MFVRHNNVAGYNNFLQKIFRLLLGFETAYARNCIDSLNNCKSTLSVSINSKYSFLKKNKNKLHPNRFTC